MTERPPPTTPEGGPATRAVGFGPDVSPNDGPIVINTPLKCGTWLLRKLVEDLTGLPWFEPPMVKPMDPGDPKNLVLDAAHFYSWHFTPTRPVADKLVRHRVRPVFLLRNVHSMVVSMYHHFANDVDWEIGRAAGQRALFARLTVDQGIRRILVRDAPDSFNWDGIGRHLFQIQEMLRFALEYPTLVVSYESLVSEKRAAIRRIAAFLRVPLDEARLSALEAQSSFESMKQAASATGGGSHFRQGRTDGHRAILTAEHRALLAEAMGRDAPELPSRLEAVGLAQLLAF